MKNFFARFAVYVVVADNYKDTFVVIDLLGQKPPLQSGTSPKGVNYRSEQKNSIWSFDQPFKQ